MSILRDLAHRENLALPTHDLDLALRYADKVWLMTLEATYYKALTLAPNYNLRKFLPEN